MKRFVFIALALACDKTGTAHEKATVTMVGALDGKEGIRVSFDACPDLSSTIYFGTTNPRTPAIPASTETCLRALAVGSKVEVALRTNRNLQTAGGIPTSIGSCTLPYDFEGTSNVTGPRLCSWAK